MKSEIMIQNNMRIALIIDRFLPQKGGGERYVALLAEGLAEKGHEVTIFARIFSGTPPALPNIHYQRVDIHTWPGFLRVILFAHRCKEAVGNGGFDIVHDVGHMVGADVFNPHGGVEQVWLKRYFTSYQNRFHRTVKRIQRAFSPKEWAVLTLQRRQYLSPETHRIIAISSMVRDHIRSHYPQIPREKIVLVRNPANLSRFSPENRHRFRETERQNLGLKENDIAILFAGNNFRLKGLYPLLQAFPFLLHASSNVYLLVAGNESPQRWRRLCRRMNIDGHVLFLGPADQIERLYAAADIFTLPSYYDSAPLVILEALASGLPVITTRWAGTSDAISDPRAGRTLEDIDDPKKIAQAIHSFFPEKRRQKALEISPACVRGWSFEAHLERVLEIYREIMREKTP